MEHLTKTQVVLLVLLVSFFTSLVTGIVTVTLVNQAPDPIVQNINRIIEKTVEKVVPGDVNFGDSNSKVSVITQEDQVMNIANKNSSAVVSVVATKDLPVIEQYFINPFEGVVPNGLFPDIQIPQYRTKGTEKKQVSSGTGFFVSKDGILLTNKHVVEDTAANYSVIMNDGENIEAEVLARDPFQDIAILKIKNNENKKEFNFIPLGDSSNVRVGQTVIAIGNVLGEFQNTLSVGVISGLNRSIVAESASGAEELRDIIQTDAAINPGNSGGPLINLDGMVIGINTAVARGAENVGFALPINIAKRDIQDAKEFGKIIYPFIGIRYVAVVDGNGILLKKGDKGEIAITAGSPAEKAGVKEGDIILEINGVKLDKNNTLSSLMSRMRVGDKINLKVMRGKEELNMELTLEERPNNL